MKKEYFNKVFKNFIDISAVILRMMWGWLINVTILQWSALFESIIQNLTYYPLVWFLKKYLLNVKMTNKSY